ncbi:MAG TPA: hypothetical protein VIP77_02705 [Jiangellaceae bacterium]
MTTAIHLKAEVGRRVEYRVHRSTVDDRADVYTPGVITFAADPVVWVRLDGQRSNLQLRADHDGLRYLDEVGPVPALPMGRFQPGTQHPAIDWAYDGVLVVEFDEGDMAAITGDRQKAEAAIATYLREQCGIDDETAISDELAELKPQWVVFEWEPEDAECAWLMNCAEQGDEQALQVHYLPTA